MNRRGFLWAAVAAGLALTGRNPVAAQQSVEEMNASENRIRAALRSKRTLRFRYHEHARRVEPHALGRMKDGRLALLGWQIAGGSQSEPPPGWRTFLLEEMKEVVLGAEKFAARQDYRPEKIAFAAIVAEVAP
ncbi:MAG TPA: WYL domain-containing protein [Lacunisphaera sp.]|nr:WYL domain-containing protein [Lacunisphaera sp.]